MQICIGTAGKLNLFAHVLRLIANLVFGKQNKQIGIVGNNKKTRRKTKVIHQKRNKKGKCFEVTGLYRRTCKR